MEKKHTREKYGVDHYFKTKEFKIKCENFYYKKWGVIHQSHVKEIQDKIQTTNLKRYAVKTYLNSKHSRNSIN